MKKTMKILRDEKIEPKIKEKFVEKFEDKFEEKIEETFEDKIEEEKKSWKNTSIKYKENFRKIAKNKKN